MAVPPRDLSALLSERQREVLDLLSRKLTNQQIADRLGISLSGAKWYVSEVITILGVDSREEAADRWRQYNGLPARLWRMLSGVTAAGTSGTLAKVTVGMFSVSSVVAAAGVIGYRHYDARSDSFVAAGASIYRADPSYVTQEENEAAVQATLACLANRGMIPDPIPARGKLVTGVSGSWPAGMLIDEARANVGDCMTVTGLREIPEKVVAQQMAAPESEKQVARDFFAACVEASIEDEWLAEAQCMDDPVAETGLTPMAPQP